MTAQSRTYVVECFSPAIHRREVERAGDRATAAAAQLRDEGRQIDYLGALLLTGDEVVFHLFAAKHAGTVRDASVRAGIDFERVLDSMPIGIALGFRADQARRDDHRLERR